MRRGPDSIAHRSSALGWGAPRRPLMLGAGALVALVGLYVLLPRLAGLDDTWGRLRGGDAAWIGLAGCSSWAPTAGTSCCCAGSSGRAARAPAGATRGA